ncbi:hypothetical protein E4U30_008256 [Claviceps sp. LM220 group G6]|nr:hypothetical protein E4U30_008256 [Claviceps sp. LM220 group G6]
MAADDLCLVLLIDLSRRTARDQDRSGAVSQRGIIIRPSERFGCGKESHAVLYPEHIVVGFHDEEFLIVELAIVTAATRQSARASYDCQLLDPNLPTSDSSPFGPVAVGSALAQPWKARSSFLMNENQWQLAVPWLSHGKPEALS